MVPDDTDILVTHGPPATFQDWVGRRRVGCADLLERVKQVKPLIHVFGHIHCAAGYTEFHWPEGGETVFVNAAVVDEGYRIKHDPTVITLKREAKV